METTGIIGSVMVVMGVLIMVGSFLAFARRRLTESFGLLWAFIGVCLLVAGIVMAVAGRDFIAVVIVMVVLGIMLLLCLFGFSLAISILIMKIQELAMQVSLLNQENESILQELIKKDKGAKGS